MVVVARLGLGLELAFLAVEVVNMLEFEPEARGSCKGASLVEGSIVLFFRGRPIITDLESGHLFS